MLVKVYKKVRIVKKEDSSNATNATKGTTNLTNETKGASNATNATKGATNATKVTKGAKNAKAETVKMPIWWFDIYQYVN